MREANLRSVTLVYDCPNLKKKLSKSIHQEDFLVDTEEDIIYGMETTVTASVDCKCGHYHNFLLKDWV